MDCSPPGSSIHGIFQTRVLEWGAIAFSKKLSRLETILQKYTCSPKLIAQPLTRAKTQKRCKWPVTDERISKRWNNTMEYCSVIRKNEPMAHHVDGRGRCHAKSTRERLTDVSHCASVESSKKGADELVYKTE